MSFQPSFPGLFTPAKGAEPLQPDLPFAAKQPATEKQIAYATSLAQRLGKVLS